MVREAGKNVFVVDLNSLPLTKDVGQRIADGIRRIVLQELATLDLKGDLVVKPTTKYPGNGHTPGMVADLVRKSTSS